MNETNMFDVNLQNVESDELDQNELIESTMALVANLVELNENHTQMMKIGDKLVTQMVKLINQLLQIDELAYGNLKLA